MRVVSVVGARPQFIKAAPVGRALRSRGHDEVLIHTGQHYDKEMSALFFQELGIPEPNYNLGVGSGRHGWQTGQMLARMEELLLTEKPDWVLLYGDTNSTLAGALAAAKLRIPIAHVEAGLRSFNRSMPEETNRILTDHVSRLLFCPTLTAVHNLQNEGIHTGVELVGDVMYDAILHNAPIAKQRSSILQALNLEDLNFLLLTVHRPSNTDDPGSLQAILSTIGEADLKVVFPVHPRTRAVLNGNSIVVPTNILAIDPVGYLDMLALEQSARVILTDSGGVQKEAYLLGVQCITLREETEWIETVDNGWNCLTGPDPQRIRRALRSIPPIGTRPSLFGDGRASQLIVDALASNESGSVRRGSRLESIDHAG